jgi:arginyl-tRNA synthetase
MRPMPIKFGVGFTASEPVVPETAAGYRYEQIGNHHNYYATAENWNWPVDFVHPKKSFIIDGFSPNLNKTLHVGHLRNLAIANSLNKTLSRICQMPICYDLKFVAMLGASLGVKKHALDGWRYWTNFLGYKPEEYFDITLPDDVVETEVVTDPNAALGGVTIWNGPYGPVIVKRFDGRPLYAFHDLTFAAYVGPTHYITGHEQKEHFTSLGLGEKHLPMGLVLGDDNKKLKSRTGDALPATEVMDMIVQRLEGSDHTQYESQSKQKLAWNILAWNFLHTTRDKNLKFEVESWTRPDQGGLYISYTFARAVSALNKKHQHLTKLYREQMLTPFTEIDISLLGFAEQYKFYFQEAVNRLDTAPIANFAFDLARLISQAYEKEKVSGGRRSFQQAFEHATWRLEMCMKDLGMFCLYDV